MVGCRGGTFGARGVARGGALGAANRRITLRSPSPSLQKSADAGHVRARRQADGKVSAGAPKMLHLDPRHTNRSPFVGPRSPTLAWSFDTGGPIGAAPAVLDDGTILVASLAGKLFALSPEGQVRYSVDLGERVYASPLVHDESIFVGSDAHRFFGLTAAGGIRFRLDTDGDVDTGAVPAPWGGIVFASGRVVYASRPDGTLLWRVKTRRKCFSSPADRRRWDGVRGIARPPPVRDRRRREDPLAQRLGSRCRQRAGHSRRRDGGHRQRPR